ncbi:LytR family transcriptional regulator [Mycetocola tolaasinivorans]|uniref:LytR family transcriptional regulator n=1 Tax=Mycetocola tolaasinivorans TaxID=76635 RepID=A0A3L7ABQ9_9MICO|nr:LytR C-terminal domain-containing protein [Mycetocola tolaasinivorans]RLP77445.1 LytR family transcriptional regulator [Mycetocola tolaasinivorans]
MRERYPHDRFDNAPKNSKRVGAHRAAGALPPRRLGWLVAIIAVVALVLAGIIYIAVQNGRIDFTPPANTSSAQPSTDPDGNATEEPGTDEGATPGNGESEAPSNEPSTPPTGDLKADPTAVVYVLNGTTTTGLSAGAAANLKKDGWTQQINVGNASSRTVRESAVYYHAAAGEQAARALASNLGISKVLKSNEFATVKGGGAAPVNQVVAVLGADYSASN